MAQMLNVTYGRSKSSTNAMGMREMQARAYAARAAQFLLLKAPPAAGKSRALMFIALDKMRHQAREKTIVCVPETSIGGSFRSTDLTSYGFEADWEVEDKWNLCLTGDDAQDRKVKAFVDFMASDAEVLVCTHATFRFAYDKVLEDQGIEAFDDCFIAVDEFHHVSASDNNRLGVILRALVAREKCHLMAMTGSYFRGDADPVLRPEDEAKFTTITYSYYEQLEGYEHLKALGVNYQFYKGNYTNGLEGVLDPAQKTIIHIPHRGSSEAFDDKNNEVGKIMDFLGTHVGRDPETGFDLIELPEGRVLKVADLVDDGPGRGIVKTALSREIKGAGGKRDDEADRAKVDIIIALGMAKEGFDWVWCEHALTIGYRSSLTEIVQIIGRATRDAPGKPRAVFTNLVAEPGVETDVVSDAVNDMLKAISGSLLMEQVLAPNFKFYRREDGDVREPVRTDGQGNVMIGIKGLIEPPTERAKEICEQDMHDLLAAACQAMDKRVLAPDTAPEVATQMVLTDIIETRYPDLNDEETESARQHLAAHMNILTLARQEEERGMAEAAAVFEGKPAEADDDGDDATEGAPNTLLQMVKKFINVREIDVDLIDSVNAFQERFEVASKSLDAQLLQHVQSAMVAIRVAMTEEEARTLWPRIKAFRAAEGREPNLNAPDALEKRMAEALAWLKTQKAKRMREGAL
ncbi:Superfamily II DNA or RNA helicase [Aliiroseovarius crassostreae]|uniref:DEAD/DEAH box helicase n=1 Tax=Aliiroseovarius crassostreae TaxID=154981 RepID=A0A0N8IB80_9RHOB|nr:DEAD/DEAH box helicase [Aliiroseovarius crassostreae]KPN62363.1 DEAD/DEAH box helicase [Aliiroseovarius crassostreae]SFU74852.1 Superfamily II DNA or RNA helicase [Aliiroseovarius crassostreae]